MTQNSMSIEVSAYHDPLILLITMKNDGFTSKFKMTHDEWSNFSQKVDSLFEGDDSCYGFDEDPVATKTALMDAENSDPCEDCEFCEEND